MPASLQTLEHNFNNAHALTSFAHKPSSASSRVAKQEPNARKARRALRSLAIAIAIPLSLTIAIMFMFGSGPKYRALAKPFWFPSLWLVHVASLATSFLMALAAWLVWADGGFHSQSDAFPLYISQVSLSVIWVPVVLVAGASWLALLFCLVQLATLFLCYLRFKMVNPFAKDLVKPCLAWVGYLAIVSLKLMYI